MMGRVRSEGISCLARMVEKNVEPSDKVQILASLAQSTDSVAT